ncbi:MAG TPA: hypothetical protein V6C58_17100, partial [Allocoleopsis sp.]
MDTSESLTREIDHHDDQDAIERLMNLLLDIQTDNSPPKQPVKIEEEKVPETVVNDVEEQENLDGINRL